MVNYILNENVFREYDVRGIADSDFSGRFPYYLGKAFASYIIKNKCGTTLAVSGDVRPSTGRLKKEFVKGISSRHFKAEVVLASS